jgi:UDP-N-acetylglucosamine acyltransferase
MSNIHPTAIIADNAQIATDVEVGPYTVVEQNASIGARTKIGSHSVIHAYVELGEDNVISDHVVLGGAPQDLGYQGDPTRLVIGDRNKIREFTSIHRATNLDQPTCIGNDCFIMSNVHIGHDCQVGDGVIITTFVGISGHVQIGDKAVIGGGAGIHQYCRIGTLAMVAGLAPVGKDVLPFCMLGRDPTAHFKLNMVGLRRAGIKGDDYRALEHAIQLVRKGKSEQINNDTAQLKILQAWLSAPSKRGIYKFAR